MTQLCNNCRWFKGFRCTNWNKICYNGSEFAGGESFNTTNTFPTLILGRGDGKTELQKQILKDYKELVNSCYGVSSDGVGTGGFTLPKPTSWTPAPEKRKSYDPGFNTIGLRECCGIGDLIELTINVGIERVIFNDPATIVYWSDDTKTVVKCGEGDTFDPEKGLAMAISKKVLGNGHSYYDTFKKHLKEKKEDTDARMGLDIYEFADACSKLATTIENKGNDNE